MINDTGLPGSYNINVFNLDNRIVFASDSGFYVYDDISDHFYKYQQLNKKLGHLHAQTRSYRLLVKSIGSSIMAALRWLIFPSPAN